MIEDICSQITQIFGGPPCRYVINEENLFNMMRGSGWCKEHCKSNYIACWKQYFKLVGIEDEYKI